MRLLLLKHARPGMVLGRPVRGGGRTLLAPGAVLTPRLLKRLGELGIQTLFVRDAGEAPTEVAQELHEVVSEQVRREAYLVVRQYMERLREGLLPSLSDSRRVTQVVASILEQVLANREVVLQLAEIRALEGYVFAHSVGVAVSTSLLGIHRGLDRKDLLALTAGGLLHDVGKVRIPDKVWQKPGPLTDEEYRMVQRHAEYGFEILRAAPGIDLRAAHVAYQRHERWDGTGYPRGLAGEKIHLFSRIVAVVDVFDAMTHDRSYRPALPAHEVLASIEKEAGRAFDPEVVRTFLGRVAPYPVGTRVCLNTGEEALVVRLNEGVPARPVVRLLAHGLELDLRTNLAQRIVGLAGSQAGSSGPGKAPPAPA